MKQLGYMDIYKNQGQSCSMPWGISENYDEVIIVDEFSKDAPQNAVVIIEDEIMGKYRIRAVPANSEKEWTMFGGCFIYTCNGVVPHYGEAIKLHDRIEKTVKMSDFYQVIFDLFNII